MRTLTVSRLHRPGDHARSEQQVPHLRLTGQWLERAGFAAGSRVTVEIREGQLVITATE